jgi:hypothetical protein
MIDRSQTPNRFRIIPVLSRGLIRVWLDPGLKGVGQR